jgi:hypothetical protein
MIAQILSALNDWIDRRNAHEDEMESVCSEFLIELHLAKCLHSHNPEVIPMIAGIAADALRASDRNDLQGMRDCLAAVQEWTR